MEVSITKVSILIHSTCQEFSFWQREIVKTHHLLLTMDYLSAIWGLKELFRYGYRLLLIPQTMEYSSGSKIRHGVIGIGLI